jgi:hypothetical protein
MRFKVVGRREEPSMVAVPSTAPGTPQVMQQVTVASLLVQVVDAEGNPLSSNSGGPAGSGSGGQTIVLSAASLADIEQYVTGSFYQLSAE